jgi:hypothetical protein
MGIKRTSLLTIRKEKKEEYYGRKKAFITL